MTEMPSGDAGAGVLSADAMTGARSAGDRYECVIIGAGPAGLSAALNLVRARRRVLLVDSNRPRNAATLQSHGFLTRNGVSPLELRKLGRLEVESYPEAEVKTAFVESVEPAGREGALDGFKIFMRFKDGLRGTQDQTVFAKTVVIATGLAETLPALPSIRAFYGMSLHSCVECDAYEKADAPLALIGESDDLAERALLLAQWSKDLIVFTNSIGRVTEQEEAALRRRGIRVERRPIADVAGDREGMTGVVLADGETIPRTGGFIRPRWSLQAGYADGLGLEVDSWGLIVVDKDGRTSVPGLYAAGDSTPPGPQQLIVAAGAGARTAATVNRDLVRADAHLPGSITGAIPVV